MGDVGTLVRAGRAVTVGVVLLLATGVGACTQDEPDADVTAPTFLEETGPVPSASPSAEPSTQPSAEPTVAAPPLPELATQQTPEGAVAFTQWWFETLNYATATGDTAGLRAASDPGCVFCQNLATQVEGAYSDGGRMQGGLSSVVVSPPGALQERGINLALVVSVQETILLNRQGQEVDSYAANESRAAVASVLTSPSNSWVMGEVSQ